MKSQPFLPLRLPESSPMAGLGDGLHAGSLGVMSVVAYWDCSGNVCRHAQTN